MPKASSGFRTADRPDHMGLDIMWPRIPTDGGPVGTARLPTLSPRHYLADGTPALAFAAGTVTKVDGAGKPYRVRIDHGGGIESQYLHLFTTKVRVGQRVRAGQRLGVIGHNPVGYKLNHLHFELFKNGAHIDPRPTLAVLDAVAYPTSVSPWLKGLAILTVGGAVFAAYRLRAGALFRILRHGDLS